MTRQDPLRDRSALVTGGSRGIGLAIARRLAGAGARVAVCARDPARLAAAAKEIQAAGAAQVFARPCDVREPAQVDAFVDEFHRAAGPIDILINNAGISGRTPLMDADGRHDAESHWHDIIATNLYGVYYVTKAVLAHMTSPGGRIVNMSSVLGRFGVPGYAAYCASKHGLIGFTRALALELAGRGITVNAICPGWVATDMAWQGMRDSAAAQGITFEAFREQAMGGVPIGRLIEPAEVAELALYLLSEGAAGITGQALNLCGGQTMD